MPKGHAKQHSSQRPPERVTLSFQDCSYEISAIETDRATCAVWLKRGDEIVVSGTAVIDIAYLH